MKYWIILIVLLFSCVKYKEDTRQCAIMNLQAMPDSLFADRDSSTQSLALVRSKLWYKDTIYVGFIDGDYEIRQKTLSTAKIWEQYCSIVFVESKLDIADVRITFNRGPSWSNIGTDCKLIRFPNPTLQLGWLNQVKDNQAEINQVVLHEFGHVLGALHEHQNPDGKIPWDSAKVYDYYMKSGWNKRMTDINVLSVQDSSLILGSRYDKNSIMMYAIPATLLKDPSYTVGWNTNLSELDKQFIGIAYPKKQKLDSIKLDSVAKVKDTIIKYGKRKPKKK